MRVSLLVCSLFSLVLASCGGRPVHNGDGGATDGPHRHAEARTSDGPVSHVDGTTTGCGVCPSGFTCAASPSGGVCKSPDGVPRFSHVFLVYMENHSLSTILGSSSSTYIQGLASTYGLAMNYHSVGSPSLPNYLALSGGSTFGVTSDCDPTGSCGCPQPAISIVDELEGAGLTWHAYAEDMTTPCRLDYTCTYYPRHNPEVYYTNLQGTARCMANDVDYGNFVAGTGNFATDLGAGGFTFMSITPNSCHDMHDSCTGDPIKDGDDWLRANIEPILKSPEYLKNGVVFIVWDEGDVDDNVIALVLSPLGKPHYTTTTHYDHYSLLATIESAYGLAQLPVGSTTKVAPMAEFFQ